MAKYDQAYQLAYDMGKSEVSLDYVKGSQTVSYLTDTQKELAYAAGKAAAESSTTLNETGETVKVKAVAALENGKMAFALENGEVVAADQLALSDSEALLHNAISGMDISAQEANRLWQGYDGSLSAEAYANGITEAYHYGRMGVPYGNIDFRAYAAALPEQVRKNAYEFGKRALDTQSPGSYNNKKEDLTNGTEAVHLRRGVQRTDGESSHGSVRSMVEGTGTVQNGQEETAGRPRDGGKNHGTAQGQISTKELGVENGSEVKNLRYAAEDTPGLVEARTLAAQYGLELVAFAGGNLAINSGTGAFEVRALIDGNRVYARADHPIFSLLQLLKHEIGHHKVRKGNVDMKKVYKAIADAATEEYVEYVIANYVAAYSSLEGYGADYILEEILCDYEAGMNIFSEKEVPASFWEMAEEILQSEDVKTDSVRGPPADSRTSRENAKKNTTEEGGVKHKDSDYTDYSKPITAEDVALLQKIGRKSINDFNGHELKVAQKWAYKFYKDLSVKSPFFRAWFGDWREASIAPAEIVSFAYGEKGKLNYNKRTVKCRDMNGRGVQVDNTVIEDSLHYAKQHGDEKQIRKLLGKIDEILEKGILLDTRISQKTSGNKKGRTQFMHYLYTPISINGAPFIAKLSVEEYDLTGKTRAYNLQRIELSTLSRAQFAEIITQNREKYAYSADALSVSQLYKFVKQNDLTFKPKPANPAFLNEDGTPKLFYHGTNAEWTRYDLAKNVNQMWGEGIYLTPDPKRAALYGDNVMPLYVKADVDNRTAKKTGKQRDYTVMKNGDVLVYSPKQIKSATDNIGTFDGSNPDIRFSREFVQTQRADGVIVDRLPKEVIPYGQKGRAEDHASFLRRMHESARRVKQVGGIAYAFYELRVLDASNAAAEARRELRRLGIKCFLHNGLEYNVGGYTYQDMGVSAALADGSVAVYGKSYGDGVEYAGHEAFHVWKNSPERAAYVDVLRENINIVTSVYGIQMADTVLKKYFDGDLSALQNTDAKAWFIEELYALVSGQLHSGAHMANLRTMLKDYDTVKSAWNTLLETQVPEQASRIKFSREASYAEQVEEVKNNTHDPNNHVYMGTTPTGIAKVLDLPKLPMLITSQHIYSMAVSEQQARAEGRYRSNTNYHQLGWETVKNLPEYINKPVLIIKSTTDKNDARFIVVTAQMDKNGNPIVAAVKPNGTGNYFGIEIPTNFMLSGYGKNSFRNFVARAKTENRILYANKNSQKNKNTPSVQYADNILSSDYITNLAEFQKIVNKKFEGTIFENSGLPKMRFSREFVQAVENYQRTVEIQMAQQPDAVQEQGRKYLDEDKRKKHSKRSKYSETETLFLMWSNGSAPVGEIRCFFRFGKIHYYEKTENGCIELSRAQYNERRGCDVQDIDRRAERGISQAVNRDGNSEGNSSGSINGDRHSGGASAVSGQAIGEKLRNDVRGSVPGAGRDNRGNAITDIDDTQYQQRADALTDRQVLALAASNDVVPGLDSGEKDALRIFRKRLGKLEALQEQRARQGRLYRQQLLGPGADWTEAGKTRSRMGILDSQIQRARATVLAAEDTAVLKRVLQKARAAVENYLASAQTGETASKTEIVGVVQGQGRVDDNETAALLAYKSGGSYLLNAKLREGMALTEQEQFIVDGLDSALEKLPVYKGKVYRNIIFDGFGDQEARDAFVSGHISGELISYAAYTSTSTAIDGYVVDGDYIVHIEIESVNGRNLEGYGNNSESEVLLPRDSNFITDKIEYAKDGTPTIYLTEEAYGEQTAETQTADGGRTERNVSGDHSRESRSSDTETDKGQVQRLRTPHTEDGKMQSAVSGRDSEGNNSKSEDLQGVQAEVTNTATSKEAEDTAVPPKAETEEAKKELRKAVRMPVQGTNMEALLQGIKSQELSMESVTLPGNVAGFNDVQREYLVKVLIDGVYTDAENIKVAVPYDGKFEISNTPGNIAKVLDALKVKVTQEVGNEETTDKGGSQEALSDDHRGQQNISAESEKTEVQQVPKQDSRNGEMQTVSERDSEVDSFGKEELPDVQFQQRADALTDRQVLALAASNDVVPGLDSGEKDALRIFRKRLGKLEALQEQRARQGRLYRQQLLDPGADRAEAGKTRSRIGILDSQIQRARAAVLAAEGTAVLKRVLQKARAAVENYQRTVATEKTVQEVKYNGTREEVSHRGNAESPGRMGKENSGGEGSARESCGRRIKEILRQKTVKNNEKSTSGRGRVELRESREEFESRSRRDGLMYVEAGSVAMAFRVAPEESWNENAKAAAVKLAQYGFDVVVFTGHMQHNRKGVTETTVDGSTTRHAGSLTIFISAELDIDGMETAYHEAFHAARYGLMAKYHEKIADIIANNVDVESESYTQFISKIADLYAYTESQVSPGKFEAEIIEEFYAWYVGKAYATENGEMQVDMAQFSDVETIKSQIDGVYAQMEANADKALPGLLESDIEYGITATRQIRNPRGRQALDSVAEDEVQYQNRDYLSEDESNDQRGIQTGADRASGVDQPVQGEIRGTTADGRGDRTDDRRLRKTKAWGDLSAKRRLGIVKTVENHINSSDNYSEIRLVLAATIGKPVTEMNLRDKQVATEMLAQKLYESITDLNNSRPLVENRWSLLGNIRPIIEAIYGENVQFQQRTDTLTDREVLALAA